MYLYKVLLTCFYLQLWLKKFCLICGSYSFKKDGKVLLQTFTHRGWQRILHQLYRCLSCGHPWHNADMIGQFSTRMVDYLAYIYLHSLSLEDTVGIVRAFFQKDYLTKDTVLDHLEQLIDRLPSVDKISKKFKPARSGYYAWDGTWLKFQGRDIVLLICFDVVSLDVVSYLVAPDECYETYLVLINIIKQTEPDILANAKGFFCDGELGLLKILRERYSATPLQLCVFHKYSRAGQIIPFVHANGMDKDIKERVEKVLFAPTKQLAIYNLVELKRYASKHQQNRKLKKIIGILKRNFELLLTHFDHPEMSPYNNVLEGFNGIIKRKFNLMKGFKKELNVDRWVKLLLLDYRFHKIHSSKFPNRNGKSPLELAQVSLPKYHNWITLVRRKVCVSP